MESSRSGSVLFVGDIHLGRRPGHLPHDLATHGLRAEDLGPAAAWRRAVSAAIEGRIDAVVLCGDVVDDRNRLFEALGPLDAGVRELTDAGIAVFAVSGNHDGDVLPRLANAVEGFRLLGQGGLWETAELRLRGMPDEEAPFARIIGWSFPGPRVTTSPLLDFPGRPAGDSPVFGVLHADLDQRSSRYAPVARAELERSALDGWFLGHVHTPSPGIEERALGYVGSLVGLDPGEPGGHGPVRVDVDAAGRVTVQRLGGAPLRWERVEIVLGDAKEDGPLGGAGLPARVMRALGDLRDDLGEDGKGALAVGCRLVLTGRVSRRRELRKLLAEGDLASLSVHRDGVLLFVERVLDRTVPAVDLESLAGVPTPPGVLARRLLALERDDPDAEPLVHEARRALESAAEDAAWRDPDLSPLELDRARVRTLLLESGRAVLDELLAQVPGPGGAGGEDEEDGG